MECEDYSAYLGILILKDPFNCIIQVQVELGCPEDPLLYKSVLGCLENRLI